MDADPASPSLRRKKDAPVASTSPSHEVGDAAAVSVTAPSYIPLAEFHIQAHRGGGRHLPECTLPTFEFAWQRGVVPEADLRTTRDGVIVAFHDEHFERLVKDAAPELAGRSIADLSDEQVAQLDVGRWMGEAYAGLRVPRMNDVFAIMQQHPERSLYLDIKDVDLPKLAEQVRAYGIERQAILASRDHAMHVQWISLLPTSNTLQWIGGKADAIQQTVSELRSKSYEALTSLQVHVHYDPKQADPFTPDSVFLARLADELRMKKIRFQVLPWHVQDQQVYRRLLDLGVASFATDYVDETCAAVRDYYNEVHLAR